MPSILPAAFGLAAALTAAVPTAAQTRPDPRDAAAPVPAQRYSSSLGSYRGLGDTAPLPWKDANGTVARIGGWRVYAREAGAATSPLTAPAAAASSAQAK